MNSRINRRIIDERSDPRAPAYGWDRKGKDWIGEYVLRELVLLQYRHLPKKDEFDA